jgi:hypothetical protein
MQYYIFDEVSPNSEAPFLELPEEIGLVESIMGKRPNFDELPIRIEAEIDEDEAVVYTDIINLGVPLFSPRMKLALEEYGVSNIDYYPVLLVESQTQEVLAEYWLGIVTDIISCIDLDKSRLEEGEMGRKVITRFAVDERKTGGVNLFRFHHIPGLIIIDEALKEALCKTDFTGVSFKPTQEYSRSV